MTFKTIQTGSGGNCFVLDSLMIDAGLPYSKVKQYLSGIEFILLTHIHGDHFNADALRKIFVYHDDIKIVCGEWLRESLLKVGIEKDRITIVEFGKVYALGEYRISPIIAYHDVENCGYRIMKDGWKHLHITDTASLEGIEANNYYSASIECNHDYDKALELINEAKENNEFSHLKGAMNSHLSVQKTIAFCKQNNIKKLYPIHIGNSTRKEVIDALKSW